MFQEYNLNVGRHKRTNSRKYEIILKQLGLKIKCYIESSEYK